MAAAYDRGDSNDRPFTEDYHITHQPQSLDLEKSEGHPADFSHLKRIPFCTVVHDGTDHMASRPIDCFQCGQEVAAVLFTQLSLGVKDLQPTPSLQFRDVMVLTQDKSISDVSGMVQGLRDARIPVRVVGEEEADVIGNVGYVDEVLVAWNGLASTETSRKVVVVLQGERSKPQSCLEDFRPVMRQAEHVIWVRHPLNTSTTTEDVVLDMKDDVMIEGTHLLLDSETHGFKEKDQDSDDDVIREEKRMVKEGNHELGVTDQYLKENARTVHAVTHAPYRANPSGTKHSSVFGSGYNPNDCCDNFCLACSQDVGESGCIFCCPCCDQIGMWCESCCRGFADSLNNCLQSLCCDCSCCPSGECEGCSGDCCDCGGCDCDCGDCNCDCGNCDCSIM